MPFPLSPQSIEALAEIISGGSANDSKPPIGLYRSGPRIERFMRSCNVDFHIGSSSRVPTLSGALIEINNLESDQYDTEKVLTKIIETAADPRDFLDDPQRHAAVLDYLNQRLAYDGLEIQKQNLSCRLVELGKSTPVLSGLAEVSRTIDFDTVNRDLGRALASIQNDPEDAITSACSTVESVCRSILIELGEPLPKKKDIQGLYDAVKKPLDLSPDRTDINPLIADDVRKILGGLHSVIAGIGALRTHGGDAHGRERGYTHVDQRIARLSVHAASTAALFLIETWQRKFPTRILHKADNLPPSST